MSADNWRICPKCTGINEAAYEASRKEITESYGKVSAEEYLRLVSIAPKPPIHLETLREDYEIGTFEDGEFLVNYSCYCSACKFEFSFKHKQKI